MVDLQSFLGDQEAMQQLDQVLTEMVASAVDAELSKQKNRQAYAASYARTSQPARYNRGLPDVKPDWPDITAGPSGPPTKSPGRGYQAVGATPPKAHDISDLTPGNEEWTAMDFDHAMSSSVIVAEARRVMSDALLRGAASEIKNWEGCLQEAMLRVNGTKRLNAKPYHPGQSAAEKKKSDSNRSRYQKEQDRHKPAARSSFQLMEAARSLANRRLAAGSPVSWDRAKQMVLAGEA